MYGNIKLYQIEATKDFGDVKKGDLGGWIEKESNLSQEGSSWVFDGAWVYGNASVSGNSKVAGNASVSGNSCVFGDAWVTGNSRVYGNSWVFDGAWVSDGASVGGNSRVYGNSRVADNASVSGDTIISGNAIVKGGLKLDTGLCFARKEKDWNVSEVENKGIILLIKDHKPVEKEAVELTVEEICDRLGYDVKIKK